MSFSQNSSPGNVVPGLTTPNLNDGELSNKSSSTHSSTKASKTGPPSKDSKENDVDTEINNNKLNNSVFEIASNLEERLRELNHNVDQHDVDVNARIDKLVTRIRALEKKMSS
ncbi:hypothetical protein CLIB1423_05S05512 [[Candida] railenensis]|uniref:Uncharacterized protein n=1 Tax=[Candida] railenensis TaxID=45579 RepID=A0A9P0QPG4_9ASCO|nr:hypothetical protein CLIB1423_05S05512 [[Candida] railenensis]